MQSRATAPRIYLSHLTENLVIEPAGKGARGISYAIYPGRNGKNLSGRR